MKTLAEQSRTMKEDEKSTLSGAPPNLKTSSGGLVNHDTANLI